jgi:hypothetical protein
MAVGDGLGERATLVACIGSVGQRLFGGGVLRKALLILVGLLVGMGVARAQAPMDTVVHEDSGWRVHAGDDAAYAAPRFDDSGWQTADFGKDIDGPAAEGHSRWFRKRVELPAGPGPIDLLLVGTTGGFEVYIDGRRVGPPILSSLRWRKLHAARYALRTAANPSTREVEVAIRSWVSYAEFFDDISLRFAVVGDPAAISTYEVAHEGRGLGRSIFSTTIFFACVIVGLLVLSLYFQQRGQREYLWLGLSVIFFALTTCLAQMENYGEIPASYNGFIGDPCAYFFLAAQLEFVYVFMGRRPGRVLRGYQALLIVTPFFLNPLLWIGALPNGTLEWVEGCMTLPGIVALASLLFVWYRRGSREAGLLLVPIFLANAANFVFDIEILIQISHPEFAIPSLTIGLVRITYAPFFAIPFLLSIGLLIFRRFSRVTVEQAKVLSDLESARTVQQILIPEALPEIAGFRVESVYHPAQQVGGDFFQIIPVQGGGVLAVLGDVSGKGLPAAMNVALIVGALRTLAETTSDPVEILAGLNRRLLARSAGFTTCLAVRILPDGAATLASAGHLNPYLDGKELVVEPNLPLGLSAEVEYVNTSVRLRAGDRLTLITDGVLEARDAVTGELFGFERTLAISGEAAGMIADTAQRFGQEDDIAVLTVAFGAV